MQWSNINIKQLDDCETPVHQNSYYIPVFYLRDAQSSDNMCVLSLESLDCKPSVGLILLKHMLILWFLSTFYMFKI